MGFRMGRRVQQLNRSILTIWACGSTPRRTHRRLAVRAPLLDSTGSTTLAFKYSIPKPPISLMTLDPCGMLNKAERHATRRVRVRVRHALAYALPPPLLYERACDAIIGSFRTGLLWPAP